MRQLDILEIDGIAGGRDIGPGSCSIQRMAGSVGFGALAGVPGFAGGPVVGASTVLFGAGVGGIAGLYNCALDLRDQLSQR